MEEAAIAGLPLRQAEALCPAVITIPSDSPGASRLAERIAAALYDLAPAVEVGLNAQAWVDLAGVPRAPLVVAETRRRLRATVGVEPRLGLAPGPFTAALAASRAAPGRLIRVEDPMAFLAPLPIRVLGLNPEQLERLDLLGLRTLGAVAALGPRQLQSQLGNAGRTAALLATSPLPEQRFVLTPA